METIDEFRVVIIGSGPAGCTAALYLSRANLIPIVLEGMQPGGQLTITTEVENYPGFPEGILGPKLMDLMRQQAERFGAVFRMESLESVDLSSRPFRITSDQKIYECEALLIASGASAMQIGLPSEKALQGFGVSYCATCDGFFFKGKEIVVVGGGDAAMQDRAIGNPKIDFILDTTVEEVIGSKEEGVKALKVRNLITSKLSEMKTQGLFVAIGHTPNTAPYRNKLTLDERGYIITNPHSTSTTIPGVFACGDVVDHIYRQAITAAGSGCQAALDCERWLTHERITERWDLPQGEEDRT